MIFVFAGIWKKGDKRTSTPSTSFANTSFPSNPSEITLGTTSFNFETGMWRDYNYLLCVIMEKGKKVKLLIFYKEGLECYRKRDFSTALNYFQKCLEIDPEDGPSKVYAERCKEYIKNPPSPDWDGVFDMKTK